MMTEQELLQVPEELRETFRILDEQGWNPRMCDTPVPYFDGRVPCGIPAEQFDCVPEGYLLLPSGSSGINSRFAVSVKGDSMVGAGIDDGDELDVICTPVASDGDIVVAYIDGETTVKMFFTDRHGRHWLVPCNKKYKPILLEKYQTAHIVGRVVKVHKEAMRGSYRELDRLVCESEDYIIRPEQTNSERVVTVVRNVAPLVKQRRHWYAVYRALIDKNLWDRDEQNTFVEMVAAAVPDHAHLPTTAELYRMEVDSFRHPVRFWDESKAPVTGARFKSYVNIANAVFEALT